MAAAVLPTLENLKQLWTICSEGADSDRCTTESERNKALAFLEKIFLRESARREREEERARRKKKKRKAIKEEKEEEEKKDDVDVDQMKLEEEEEPVVEPEKEEEKKEPVPEVAEEEDEAAKEAEAEEEEKEASRKKRRRRKKGGSDDEDEAEWKPPSTPIVVSSSSDEDRGGKEEKKERKIAAIFQPVKAKAEAKLLELRDFQVVGKNWLLAHDAARTGCILADDMGKGKSLQVIALIAESLEKDPTNGPTLILVKPGTELQWLKEIGSSYPLLLPRCLQFKKPAIHRPKGSPKHLSPAEVARLAEVVAAYMVTLGRAAVVVASHSQLSGEISKMEVVRGQPPSYLIKRDATLIKMNWHRVVIDESQFIRNPRTRLFVAANKLQTERRICMTGTPGINREADIAAQCEFLRLSPYSDAKWWTSATDATRLEFQNTYMLRRLRETTRTEETVLVVPTEEERALYLHILETADVAIKHLRKMGASTFVMRSTVFAWINQLRQVANDARLLRKPLTEDEKAEDKERKRRRQRKKSRRRNLKKDFKEAAAAAAAAAATDEKKEGKEEKKEEAAEEEEEEEEVVVPLPDDRKIPEGVGSKTKRVIEKSMELLAADPNRKQIVMSSWTSQLDLLEEEYRLRGIAVCRIDGSVPSQKREAVLEMMREDPTRRVLLLSLMAGGVGLNIQCCHDVLVVDQWYNVAAEIQAICRADREGQTQQVRVYRFEADLSIEKALAKMKAKKTALVDRCIGRASATGTSKQPSLTDLQETFMSCIRMTKEENAVKEAAARAARHNKMKEDLEIAHGVVPSFSPSFPSSSSSSSSSSYSVSQINMNVAALVSAPSTYTPQILAVNGSDMLAALNNMRIAAASAVPFGEKKKVTVRKRTKFV